MGQNWQTYNEKQAKHGEDGGEDSESREATAQFSGWSTGSAI